MLFGILHVPYTIRTHRITGLGPFLFHQDLPQPLAIASTVHRLLRLQALGVRCLQALGIDEHMPAPKDYTCPITATGEAMIDPVVDALGITYERAAIERWLKDHNTSPLSMKKLPDKRLVPNFALWSIIEDWEKKEHEKYMALATA